jgi:fermentation-respiration switch protein FrsA (DUF1100 family)
MRIAVVLILAYVAWCLLLYVLQDRIVFMPEFAPAPSAQLPFPSAETLTVELDSGETVYAWFIPAPGLRPGERAPVVMYFHGNSEIIDELGDFVAGYHQLGCSVLLPEYRGYGRAGGKPSQNGIRDDCVRFYDMIASRAGVDPARIAFHGRSLGGAVAADLAAHRRPGALILQSTFTSVVDMARQRFFIPIPDFLIRHPYRTDRLVTDLDIPVLVLHGSSDWVIPVGHGRRLGATARNGTYVEYDSGHNDLPPTAQRTEYWNHITSVLERGRVKTERSVIRAHEP